MATITTREEYLKDTRTPCKYGFKCYQKNPVHHEKFKHPPKPTLKPAQKDDVDETINHIDKKLKPNAPETEVKIAPKNAIISPKSAEETASVSTSTITESPSDISKEISEQISDSSMDEDDFSCNETLDNIAFIESKFLVKMPADFYSFWELCQELQPKSPESAFKSAGLVLVGPYDVLAGKFKGVRNKKPEEYLVHWRYFYDPPEFQTIIKGDDSTGFHLGYFRDSPKDFPVFVAGNHAKKDCEIKALGGNVFGAVYNHLENLKKTSDPFAKLSISKLQNSVKAKADKLKIDITSRTEEMKMRRSLAKTFHRAGIVVPYNRKTQLGYRDLLTTEPELKKLIGRIASATEDQKEAFMGTLTDVITATNIANDECDFGTGLELGLDLFSSGVERLHRSTLHFLTTAYSLLGREEFGKIAEAHLANRKKGTNLSVL